MSNRGKAAIAVVEKETSWLEELYAEGEAEQLLEDQKSGEPITSEVLMGFAAELMQIEEQKAQLSAELKQVDDRRKQLRTQLIPDAMKELNMVNAKGKGSFTYGDYKFHLEHKVMASCSKENRPIFFAYLRKQGDDEIIQEVVNPMTLSAYVRECRADGLNDPPGLSVHEEVTAKMTKAR